MPDLPNVGRGQTLRDAGELANRLKFSGKPGSENDGNKGKRPLACQALGVFFEKNFFSLLTPFPSVL
jgi:hypothetical protein